MINRQFTVSTADLNTHSDIFVDTLLQITQTAPTTNTGITDYSPKKMQIINDTGIDVLVNILSNVSEYNAFVANPSNYGYFTVKNNTSVVLTAQNVMPTAYKVVVKGGTGSGTAPLAIDCIQYIPIR